ncbi:hypothetical protein HJB89_10875 [Rhizobium sp. NZLR8]|nr:hypothetical protein [Rhizobium sp. NZLR8]
MTDTTLGIACTYFKIRTLTCFDSDQLRQPSRPPDTRNRQWLGRQNGYSPSCCRRRRMPKISGLGLPPPPSDHETDGARALGGQLQATRNDHWQADRFGDDSAKPSEPQRLLAGLKDVFLADRFNVDDTIRMKADLGQGGGEQVGTSQAPDDLPLCPSSDPSCKHGCSSAIDSSGSASCKFVDRSICQAAARKSFVDLTNAKWQDGFRTDQPAFEMLNAVSKIGNDRVRGCLRHSEPSSKSGFQLAQKRVCSVFVPNLHMSQCACAGE